MECVTSTHYHGLGRQSMLPAANCFVSHTAIQKCISLPNPQKAGVDNVKHNHSLSSLPLLARVISKAITTKLQNMDVFFSSASVLTSSNLDTYTRDLIYSVLIGRLQQGRLCSNFSCATFCASSTGMSVSE